MNKTSVKLTLGGREFILIGTAHVSKESIAEVREAITEEKPDMVCVELDQGRYDSISKKDNWDKLDVSRVLREGKGFLLIANLVLAGFQRRLGEDLGVTPGDEMKVALETAAALGIPYALCDREIKTTLRRAWGRCGFWNKSKLMASLVSSAFTKEKLEEAEIEKLKSTGELDNMMSELAAYLPGVKETLIDERDRYRAAKIWAAGGRRPLAVLGAGHLAGLRSHLEKIAAGEESTDVAALDTIPPPSIAARFLPWLVPAVLTALVAFTVYRFGAGTGFPLVLGWILWNGGLAAAGTLLAGGHPLSILASFVGAPIATVNPVLGVGLFAGVTEAALRKPRVEDAETISADIATLRGIYRNRITRALLVFLLSSIGGIVGNVISIRAIAGTLF
ncbi:MAG: TraB/GumN family protein [Treponema sp.]|nr:TraB/GumN family protein [Treponema sp.]